LRYFFYKSTFIKVLYRYEALNFITDSVDGI